MFIARQLEMDDLVASGRFIGAAPDFEAEVRAIPLNRALKIANADAGVQEASHGDILSRVVYNLRKGRAAACADSPLRGLERGV